MPRDWPLHKMSVEHTNEGARWTEEFQRVGRGAVVPARAGIWRYGSPAAHEAVSEIIRRHSANHRDVRQVALAGRDLSSVERVLDLGCGFGFMAEAVARRAAPEAVIVGVDAGDENEAAFLAHVGRTGRRAEFERFEVRSELPWPAASFDLVLSSYSLYFFPQILPEIARVLTPGGRLLAVTHDEAGVREQVMLMEGDPRTSELLRVVRRFSAENAAGQLACHFRRVERIDYPNRLVFEAGDIDELVQYLNFKVHLLVSRGEAEERLARRLCAGLKDVLAEREQVVVSKNDAVFWAEGARRGSERG